MRFLLVLDHDLTSAYIHLTHTSTTPSTYTGCRTCPKPPRSPALARNGFVEPSLSSAQPTLTMLQSLHRTTRLTASRQAPACVSVAPFSSRSSNSGGKQSPSPPPSTPPTSRRPRPPPGARGAGRAVYDYLLLFKPFNVLCQFSAHEGKRTLADVLPPTTPRDVYPVGRLDYDSEGLLLLTNDKAVNNRMLDPAHEHERKYLVQVEGEVTEEALSKLRKGGLELNLGQGKTHRSRPCPLAEHITLAEGEEAPASIGPREPPIRVRNLIPTSWVQLSMTEGKNRQVRRMVAAVGFPCLRLVRWQVERLDVAGLGPGEVRALTREETYQKLNL